MERIDKGLILKALGGHASQPMKTAAQALIFLSVIVSGTALCGFMFLFGTYCAEGAFSQVLRAQQDPRLLHLVYEWAVYSMVALAVTFLLWRTYRREYGTRQR